MHRKKFDRLTLHVGHDKTGSTAIQCAMDSGRPRLLQDGILYPHGHWHARLGSYFHEEPENFGDNHLQGTVSRGESRRLDAEWMARLRHGFESTGARNVILSYEGFFTLPEIVLARIKAFALRHADEVRVLAYCRGPMDYAMSAISQRVKSAALPWDRYTGKLAALREGKFSGDPDWRLGLPVVFYKHDLEKLARVFGKESIQLRKFGRHELINGHVVTDFLSAIGGNDALIRDITSVAERENLSLSSHALQAGVRIIEKLGGTADAIAVFRKNIVPLLQQIPGPKYSLNDDEAWAIRAASRKESVYLEKEWGISFGDTGCVESGQSLLADAEVDAMALAVMGRAGLGGYPAGAVSPGAFPRSPSSPSNHNAP